MASGSAGGPQFTTASGSWSVWSLTSTVRRSEQQRHALQPVDKALADHAFILEGGRIRFEGSVAEPEAGDSLHRTYFGLS
jgi:hypothetical protein